MPVCKADVAKPIFNKPTNGIYNMCIARYDFNEHQMVVANAGHCAIQRNGVAILFEPQIQNCHSVLSQM